ncbi:MAG: FtsQ-type POTRA domain-containing protein [Candidatus Zixiibacteriota bacterium]
MKKNLFFFILTFLILLFGGAYFYAFYSPVYHVAEIQVKGTKKIAPEEIKKKTSWCVGKNIFSLKLEQVQEQLLEDTRLKSVQVSRMLPHTVTIQLEEKTPVLWINLPAVLPGAKDYGFYGLSEDQEIIPLDKDDLSRDMPIVSGVDVREINGTSSLLLKPYQRYYSFKTRRALDFYDMLTDNDPDALKLLAEINVSDSPNLILYLLPFGNKVFMGSGDYRKKWNRLKTILGAEDNLEELSSVDLRFDDQAVLTRTSKDLSVKTDSSSRSPAGTGKHLKNKRG